MTTPYHLSENAMVKTFPYIVGELTSSIIYGYVKNYLVYFMYICVQVGLIYTWVSKGEGLTKYIP